MISQHTPEGIYLYASPACRTLLGYAPEELIGHSAYEFFHPDDLAEIQKPIGQFWIYRKRIRLPTVSVVKMVTTSGLKLSAELCEMTKQV
jgi:PAS domain S-box-containing protein